MPDLQTICNWVVLCSAVIIAFENIYRFAKKPVEKTGQAINESIQQQVTQSITDNFDKFSKNAEVQHQEILKQISLISDEQDKKIDLLMNTSKDVLRSNIMSVYNRNHKTKTLTITEREVLDEFYSDYTALGGNGSMKKLYERMDNWTVIDDDEL